MLNIDKIVKVYNGKLGCMCGCGGKYSYTVDGAKNFAPGYNVDDSVNERSVRIIAKRVLTNPKVQWGDGFAWVEDHVRNRMQVVFFKEQK